jgi:hypothetical protein
MNSRKSASAYGWMGFCRKAKVSIPYTVTNILLCDGCLFFEARPLRNGKKVFEA